MYTPTPEVEKILEWAKQEVASVPYAVTSRWAFYQCVQKYGVAKDFYRKFLKWSSRARKKFWNGWSPTTFMDDTRDINVRDGGYSSEAEWLAHFIDEECTIRVRERQPNILLVLYEAAAMSAQFDYYLGPLRISSSPFRGDTSIFHKWTLSKKLEQYHRDYPDKPIIILYFGDLDPKGLEIPLNALKDIWTWMSAPDLGGTLNVVDNKKKGWTEWKSRGGKFRWIRVALNPEQVGQLNIPENPEKPGTYQWEALSDPQASDIILNAVREFWSEQILQLVEAEEQAATQSWRTFLGSHQPGPSA